VNLRGAAVFLDFDGTVTTYDTGLYLLEQLAAPEWRAIEQRYLAGEIGSRECMVGQWDLVPRDRDRIESVTRAVPLDPGFPALVDHLRSAGATVTIVSDGYGFRAREVAADAGLPVLTNDVDWATFEIRFPDQDPSCPCAACGTCKQAPIREAQSRGAGTVLIGDGASDAKAAELADVVFAKDRLAGWCRDRGRAFTPFSDLTDLVSTLVKDADLS